MAKTKREFKVNRYENDKCELFIRPELCKGCEVCVAFCPTQALTLDTKNKICAATYMEKCIACGMCEVRCPDFAIYIVKKEKKSPGETKK